MTWLILMRYDLEANKSRDPHWPRFFLHTRSKNSPRMWLNNTIKVLSASRKISILRSPSGTRKGSFRPAKQMLRSSSQILATSFPLSTVRFPRGAEFRNRLVMIPWSLKSVYFTNHPFEKSLNFVLWFRYTYMFHSSVVRLTLLVPKHLDWEIGKRVFSKRISNMLCQWLTKSATSTEVASDFKEKIKQEAKSKVITLLMTILV